MKKTLLFTLSLLSATAFGQTVEVLDVDIQNTPIAAPSGFAMKTTACGPDTIRYAQAKATGFSALNINNATSASGISQYYDAPQAITISGVEMFAYKIDATGGTTMTIDASIYAAGPDSLPTGAPLATTTITIDTNFYNGNLNLLRKTGSFTPTTVTSAYVIVMSNNTASGAGLIFNSYTAADGANEWLCGVQIGANWLPSYQVNVGGTPFNADALLHPVVSYDLNADFTVSDPCLQTQPIAFTNNSSPIVAHRMYNQAAFQNLTNLSYTWNYGDGAPTENVVDGLHAYANTTITYNVTLSDTIYGWSTTCADDTTITIGDALTPAMGSSIAGLSVNYSNVSTTSTGVASQLWDFGDGNTSTQANPMHTYPVAGTYTVCLTVTTNCGLTDSTCATITVPNCTNPIADFTSSTNSLTATFTNTSTTTGTTTYLWDFGDGNTSTQSDPVHTYAASGVYTVCVLVSDSCGSDTTCYSLTVTECATPTANFTVTDNDPTFDFTNTSSTTGTATYAWSFGDGNSSTQESPSHTYSADGTYTVVLIVSDSCGVDSLTQTVTVDIFAGIDELDLNAISIYPNPSTGEFVVEAGKVMRKVQVIDASGKIVYNEDAIGTVKDVKLSVANGIYTLQVSFDDGAITQKRIEIVR